MKLSFDTSAFERFGAKVSSFPGAYDDALSDTMEQMGVRVVYWAQVYASGRPGPNVVSGAYRAGFYPIVNTGGSKKSVAVWNVAPQTARLEFGFYGVDSLGRTYNQAPLPHMRPAVQQTYEEFKPVLKGMARRVWRSL